MVHQANFQRFLRVDEERQRWPGDIEVSVSKDKSKDVNDMLTELQNSVLAAVLLVFIVIIGILGIRSAMLVAVSIPGSYLLGILLIGAFGSTINMMVLFSWPGRLDLLPALPRALARGSLSGILARGQIKISRLEWDKPAGHIDLTLTSRIAQSVKLRLPKGTQTAEAKVLDGKAALKELTDAPNCRELTLPGAKTVRVQITLRGRGG